MADSCVVRPGDTIESIAEAHGLAPDVVWGDAANASLRELRVDRNLLMAGDVVSVPDARPKTVRIESARVAVFKRRGVPSLFRVRFVMNGHPRRDLPWTILLKDGARLSGRTDGNGVLRAYIHPSNKEAALTLGDDEPCELRLGFLDPANTISGVQQRLHNLGFECPDSGALDDATRAALGAFQRARGLDETDEVDAPTRRALEAAHGDVRS